MEVLLLMLLMLMVLLLLQMKLKMSLKTKRGNRAIAKSLMKPRALRNYRSLHFSAAQSMSGLVWSCLAEIVFAATAAEVVVAILGYSKVA